jgi:hypothetical protein
MTRPSARGAGAAATGAGAGAAGAGAAGAGAGAAAAGAGAAAAGAGAASAAGAGAAGAAGAGAAAPAHKAGGSAHCHQPPCCRIDWVNLGPDTAQLLGAELGFPPFKGNCDPLPAQMFFDATQTCAACPS